MFMAALNRLQSWHPQAEARRDRTGTITIDYVAHFSEQEQELQKQQRQNSRVINCPIVWPPDNAHIQCRTALKGPQTKTTGPGPETIIVQPAVAVFDKLQIPQAFPRQCGTNNYENNYRWRSQNTLNYIKQETTGGRMIDLCELREKTWIKN